MSVPVHMVPRRISGNVNGFCADAVDDDPETEPYSVRTAYDGLRGAAGISRFMKQFMIAGIRFYQKFLSPLKTTRCPYIPTCSAYGLEAVQKYGAWKGGWLALWRIMRCNPFSHGGYDPVP